MRYELKMVFPENEYASIVNNLVNSTKYIREIYHERQVNNIYFDTLNYSDYIANLHGDSNRKKYRIRWYDGLFGKIEAPVLELKYKRGLVGGKKNMKLPCFTFDGKFDFLSYEKELSDLIHTFDEQCCAMIGELMQRNSVLVNSYQRRYFLTLDKKYRITLDKRLWYSSLPVISLKSNANLYEHMLVLEVKFDENDYLGASSLINELGYRICRHSKYVNGMKATMPILS